MQARALVVGLPCRTHGHAPLFTCLSVGSDAMAMGNQTLYTAQTAFADCWLPLSGAVGVGSSSCSLLTCICLVEH
jgi:hypothetical protein